MRQIYRQQKPKQPAGSSGGSGRSKHFSLSVPSPLHLGTPATHHANSCLSYTSSCMAQSRKRRRRTSDVHTYGGHWMSIFPTGVSTSMGDDIQWPHPWQTRTSCSQTHGRREHPVSTPMGKFTPTADVTSSAHQSGEGHPMSTSSAGEGIQCPHPLGKKDIQCPHQWGWGRSSSGRQRGEHKHQNEVRKRKGGGGPQVQEVLPSVHTLWGGGGCAITCVGDDMCNANVLWTPPFAGYNRQFSRLWCPRRSCIVLVFFVCVVDLVLTVRPFGLWLQSSMTIASSISDARDTDCLCLQ